VRERRPRLARRNTCLAAPSPDACDTLTTPSVGVTIRPGGQNLPVTPGRCDTSRGPLLQAPGTLLQRLQGVGDDE
jgi:hypothetical protein